MSDPDRLVECAKFFHHHLPADVKALPTAFDDERHALECMRTALLVEAHAAMQQALAAAPDAPVSNAIDLTTDAPGIARTIGGKVITRRSDDVVRPVEYAVGTAPVVDVDESQSPPKVPPHKRAQSLKAAERSIASAHERAERRAAESFMTPEERREKVAERKAERERKKAERESAKRTKASTEDEHDAEGAPREEETKSEQAPEAAQANPPDDDAKTAVAHDLVETLQRVAPMGDAPKRAKRAKRSANESEPEFYSSPAPFDRYLQALEGSGLHPDIRDTLLTGSPAANPGVVITHGPPGCGKTHALLQALADFHDRHPDARCFVCGPTNVSAADLYARAFASGLVGCLALSKENMPPGVPRPRAMELRDARFVFGTVAGRNSPRLVGERFHAVFLDEAGLCTEASTWGLLRPDVRYVWMVGDLKQLGAVTSTEGHALGHDRSLMERLISLGVASTTLDTQRRMHAEICDYPNRTFYDGALLTDQVHETSDPTIAPYRFVDVRGDAQLAGTSSENVLEAQAAVRVALELKRTFANTVLLTPYAAQLQRLRAAQCGVPAYTVDSFQGKEADAVVLSTVRVPASGSGFWADERRLNVALTRARHAMRLVGHGGWDFDTPLGALAADAANRGCLASS